ncbi:MAG: PorP/SprF family type IX secretion system membrane protein [Bacteroidetes bacterium]|nr:PorP/SprF family type IX secretion system membrane protein [Bacteroidota bacterium]
MVLLLRCSILFFLLSSLADLQAQDPAFSQYDANQLYYNPAYAGYKKEMRVKTSYRNLWPNVPGKSVPGPLSIYAVMADAYLSIHNKFNAGGGAFVVQRTEGEGFLTTTSVGITYSQHMPGIRTRNDHVDRFNIYLGFKVYYNNIHLDWSRLVFSDQLNATYGLTGGSSFDQTTISSRHYVDFDYGILLRNNFQAKSKWYNEIGFSMGHVLRPAISITGSNGDKTKLPRKYVVSYRSTISLRDENFYISPTVLFENQAKFFEVNAGIDFYMKFKSKKELIPLSVGLYNRFSFILKNSITGESKINTSAVILAITHRGSFASSKNALGYSVGVSVDFPYMGLGMQTAGAYEISLGLSIPYRKRNVMKCPFEAF